MPIAETAIYAMYANIQYDLNILYCASASVFKTGLEKVIPDLRTNLGTFRQVTSQHDTLQHHSRERYSRGENEDFVLYVPCPAFYLTRAKGSNELILS